MNLEEVLKAGKGIAKTAAEKVSKKAPEMLEKGKGMVKKLGEEGAEKAGKFADKINEAAGVPRSAKALGMKLLKDEELEKGVTQYIKDPRRVGNFKSVEPSSTIFRDPAGDYWASLKHTGEKNIKGATSEMFGKIERGSDGKVKFINFKKGNQPKAMGKVEGITKRGSKEVEKIKGWIGKNKLKAGGVVVGGAGVALGAKLLSNKNGRSQQNY